MRTRSQPGGRRSRVGVYGVSVDEGRLLLTLTGEGNLDAGKWTLPGGGVNWGETLDEALHREFHEETGLRASVGPVLGANAVIVDRLHWIRIIYEVAASGEPTVTEVGGSTEQAAWVDLRRLADLPLSPIATSGLRFAGIQPRS